MIAPPSGPNRPTQKDEIVTALEPRTSGTKEPYRAFQVSKTPSDQLIIFQMLAASQAPEWRYYMNMIFNRDDMTEIVLVFSHMLVIISGRNLKELSCALLKKNCLWIQEYHPNEFLPSEPGEAIIESIKVILRNEEQTIADKIKPILRDENKPIIETP